MISCNYDAGKQVKICRQTRLKLIDRFNKRMFRLRNAFPCLVVITLGEEVYKNEQ